ncbi:MAG TPA: DUF1697 domain-containing protein [Candidatus Nanoarchaeia archaeon]|nr:DUF1697 domain-containing protein [Candidatus Nanoarchaeia archaeon]
MDSYVLFLRAVNVGGNNLVKMSDVCKSFADSGFKNVSSYIQTGNIIFESSLKEEKMLEISKKIMKKLAGKDIEVFLRKSSELKEIAASGFFKSVKSKDAKLYVSFISKDLGIKFPFRSKNGDVEILGMKNGAAFCVSYPYKGKYGFPNGFIESNFGVLATTRNWNVIQKISEKL